MRNRVLLYLLAMFVLLPGRESFCLSMDEAVRLALENNHRIKQYGFLEDSAQETVGAAWSEFMPWVDLGYSYTRRDEPAAFSGKTSTTYTAEASYNLFDGLSDVNSLKGARQDSLAASFDKRAKVADIILAVKEAYINALKAEELVETARESVELLQKQRDDSALFYEEGLIAKNDLLKVEVELASAQQDLLRAEGDSNVTMKRLERLISSPLPEDAGLEKLQELPKIDDLTYDALNEEMLGSRSELKFLDARSRSHRYSARSLRGDYVPSVDVSVSYSKNKNDGSIAGVDLSTEETKGMVTAQWNVFSGFNTRHRASEAELRARSTDEELEDTRQELQFQLRETLEAYGIAKGSLNVADKAVLQAEENYRVTENLYRERAATTTDLLDARTFLTRARFQYIEALYDIHLSASRIERVLERGVKEYY